jgi:hypothetical protein
LAKSVKDEIKPENRVTATKSQNVRCIGGVCFNPETGKIEIELNRESCPPDVIKGVIENIVKGAEVEFVLPKAKTIEKP